jgi:hypothetical protein
MDKLKWNTLAEMHLLLREHGWEVTSPRERHWIWKLRGRPVRIFTTGVDDGAEWCDLNPNCQVGPKRGTVASLKRKLKQVVK